MSIDEKTIEIVQKLETERQKTIETGLSLEETNLIHAARNVIVSFSYPEERIFAALVCLYNAGFSDYTIDFYQKASEGKPLTCSRMVGVSDDIIDIFYKDPVNPNSRLNRFEKGDDERIIIDDPETDRPKFTKLTGIKKSTYFRANGNGILGFHSKEGKDLTEEQTIFVKEYIRSNLSSTIKNAQDRIIDGMTGLYQKTYILNEILPKAYKMQLRNKPENVDETTPTLAAIFIDLNQFKSYNDNYGHLQGDKAIKRVADVLKANIRDTDYASTEGGDEFMILMPQTSKNKAYEVAKRIKDALENEIIQTENGLETRIQGSLGVATVFSPGVDKSEDLIRIADVAMYNSKKNGGNEIVQI